MLKRLYEIEEMKLRQCKPELKVETEIAKAKIEELVYEHTKSETTQSYFWKKSTNNKKSISFLQPRATPYKTGLLQMRELL